MIDVVRKGQTTAIDVVYNNWLKHFNADTNSGIRGV